MKHKRYFYVLISGFVFIGLFTYLLIFIFNARTPSLKEYGKSLALHTGKQLDRLEQSVRDAIASAANVNDATKELWNSDYLIKTFGADYTLLVFRDDSLVFWNNSAFSQLKPDSLTDAKGILNNKDGVFIYAIDSAKNYTFLMIEPMFLRYPIRNQYVMNGFSSKYEQFNDKIKIVSDLDTISAYRTSLDGYSSVYISYQMDRANAGIVNMASKTDLILVLIVLLLFAIHRAVKNSSAPGYLKHIDRFFPWLIFVFFFTIVQISGRKYFPDIASDSGDFFSAVLYFDGFPASWSIVFLFLSLCLSRLIKKLEYSKINLQIRLALLIVLLIAFSLIVESIFTYSLQQSTTADAILDIENIKLPMVLKLLGLFLVAASTIVLAGDLLLLLKEYLLTFPAVILITILPWVIAILIWVTFDQFFVVLSLLPPVILVSIFHSQRYNSFQIKSTPLILIWIVVSIGLASTFSLSNQRIADEEQMLTAKKLSADKDPLLEFLFNDLRQQWMQDSILNRMIFDQTNEDQIVNAYIREKYLQGYLARYETEVTTCYSDQDLILQPENRKVNCLDYFGTLSSIRGDSLRPGGLFLIDNNLLGVHYVGYITLRDLNNPGLDSLHIFVEFFHKYIPEGTGYPDLLIDADRSIGPDLNKYSFATYREGTLYYKFGSYFFPLRLEQIASAQEGFFNRDGYRHAILKYSDKTLIISRKEKGWAELLAPFSFFLLINGLIIILINWIRNGLPNFKKTFATFRTRLQLIISVSLLASFALIGTITTVYLAEIYRKKNDDFLAEKTQSLIVELEHKLKDLPIGGQSMRDYLNQILLKFSLVFFTDINLYDVDGRLLATSRPEIFDLGLAGEMMNPAAFKAMHIQNRLYLRQYEEIGKAGFISAYAPFKNSFGEAIAYINLPYFVKETEMQREVRSMVLSYLNIFLLLSALSLLFALFVSRRLTRPLQMIQQKMSRVQLGHANEKINYQRYDEIGELVNQYNTLLDQLALSAELLARSERESAWREMARQVAHEIKNPLTPMRLSVQYLLRAWDDKDPDIDQKLKNISQTLISQIDTLSSIASAFSDFAVMPPPKPVKLDLADVLRKVVNLFDHQQGILFTLNIDANLPAMVEADPENLNRIFTNLIKNAIQAIGSKPHARLTVSLGETDGMFVIAVEDTGKGMSEEEARKVFTPNFTTKSSGMGMGLSIVYSLVQQAGGKISFKTKPGEGTTFTVELPKAEATT